MKPEISATFEICCQKHAQKRSMTNEGYHINLTKQRTKQLTSYITKLTNELKQNVDVLFSTNSNITSRE